MTTKSSLLKRRTVIRGLLAAGAFGATSRFWAGCTSAPPQSQTSPAASPVKTLTIGYIYVGPKDDYGYNQAHAEGEAALTQLNWVKTVDQASVPETVEVQEVMREMIKENGAQVLFPASYGYYDPHILKLAQEFPEVQFFHPGALYKEGVHPKNVGSYLGYLIEPAYLAGIVAAHTSKTGKLGFVVPKPIPIVVREVNAFTLGARSVQPDLKVQAIFTGDWSMPVKEAEATNSLIDQGADVITSRVDNLKVVITTAEKRGVFTCGYHINQSSLAPKGYLTGVEWNWAKIYTNYAEMIRDGKTLMNGGIPHMLRGGLKEEYCKISPYGPAVSETAKKAADEAKAKLLDGSLVIFKGELKDNKGKVVIPAGKQYTLQDPQLETIDWLVEGVVGDPKNT
ncbi:BMP family ABC transporter substrate-binding protein [Kovacikia minuta CCNUW1]|uniref:BMP family ABC transporter substrate-binding protein n=1 Tax=Kovacikia minuta TaxID=2931930 RepID=UPI001CCF8076|nr:BMP family ABC transporter substrate-binding protein [Kovacikia minuta]UBF27828.1 BMP family ABC transporter substrate-binding protein [Kovacikia minuta CCNUW1]